MRRTIHLAGMILALAALDAGHAYAANICRADQLSCATTMPVGGYCECRSHGDTQGGTVEAKPAPRRPVNATAGGCGANPRAPGCH